VVDKTRRYFGKYNDNYISTPDIPTNLSLNTDDFVENELSSIIFEFTTPKILYSDTVLEINLTNIQ